MNNLFQEQLLSRAASFKSSSWSQNTGLIDVLTAPDCNDKCERDLNIDKHLLCTHSNDQKLIWIAPAISPDQTYFKL